MANLSKIKREKMLDYLEKLKEINNDDENIRAITEIENALNEKKYGLVWEEHSEKVDEELVHNIPIFVEDENRKITANEDEPYNFLLEGDNLHSLKLLEKTHKGKIDVIYIDPPYNTGSDDENFKYNDCRVEKNDSYRHSKWLSFMEKRISIAKELLSDNGVIFISIDDNEVAQLKLLCDYIFGEVNFINTISVKMSEPTGVKMTHVGKRLPKLKEYLLFYKKTLSYEVELEELKIPKSSWDSEYKILVEGVTREELDILKSIIQKENPTTDDIVVGDAIANKMKFSSINKLLSGIKTKEARNKILIQNSYRILRDVATSGGAKTLADAKKKNVQGEAFLILTPKKKMYLMKSVYNDFSSQPRCKLLFADQYLEYGIGDFWSDIKTTGLGDEGNIEFLNGKKPISLLKRVVQLYKKKEITILDFFAGSGTTGHAVMQLNKEDGGNRKYILCTNNENNICEEVTYQRLKNIQEELPHNLKYYKTEFIPKFSDDEESISEKMMEHIRELIELEHAIELDGKKYIVLDDEDKLDESISKIENGGKLFVRSGIFLSRSNQRILEEKDVSIIEIPEYYFREELKEVGEL